MVNGGTDEENEERKKKERGERERDGQRDFLIFRRLRTGI